MALVQPQPPQKKKGLGCLGCGCAILLAILLLVLAFFGAVAYYSYHELALLSSPVAMDIPAYAGSDDVYNGASKKIADFNQAVGTGNPGSLTLSADEINSLIAHNPDLARYHVRAVVTLNGDEAHLEGTVPTSSIPFVRALVKDRYLNLDATFALTFNSDTKMIGIDLHKMQLGETEWPTNQLPTLQAEIDPGINTAIRKNRQAANALLAAKTVTIRDGNFVIETK